MAHHVCVRAHAPSSATLARGAGKSRAPEQNITLVTELRAGVEQRLRERHVEAGSVGCSPEPTDAGYPVRHPPAMQSR